MTIRYTTWVRQDGEADFSVATVGQGPTEKPSGFQSRKIIVLTMSLSASGRAARSRKAWDRVDEMSVGRSGKLVLARVALFTTPCLPQPCQVPELASRQLSLPEC